MLAAYTKVFANSAQLTRENRHLRQLEIRQTKALQKYERSEFSLPGILHHHQKQAEGLKDQIKKLVWEGILTEPINQSSKSIKGQRKITPSYGSLSPIGAAC